MIVIGDVHGCYKTLMALVDQLPKDEELCFVGDLIDRGDMSSQVVEFVKANNHYCVKGNHEDMMVKHVPAHPYSIDTPIWLYNGGNDTLASYSDMEQYEDHLEWMHNLPLTLEFPEIKLNDRHLLVSHSSAGKVMSKPENNQRNPKEDIMWNRDISYGTLKSSNNFYNIFGHTVHKTPKITDFFACIDTGAVYKQHKGYGNLTAIQFPSLKIYTQENVD